MDAEERVIILIREGVNTLHAGVSSLHTPLSVAVATIVSSSTF